MTTNQPAEDENIKKVNYIIKSDFLGSAEAIEESLEKIGGMKVKPKIIHKGLGNITDGDILKAEATKSVIIGFNVKVPPAAEELAREKGVKIKLYRIIYDLINDAKEDLNKLVELKTKRVDLGKLRVMAIFRSELGSQIVGGKIIEGKVEKESFVEVERDSEIIDKGKIARLQAGKQDVKVVEEGQECGLQYEGKPIIREGDILIFYKEEKVVGEV
jgi:translation initiation factor IF-2